MNFYLKTFLVLGLLTFIFFGIHYFLGIGSVFLLWEIYVFLFCATYATICGLRFSFKFNEQTVAYIYLLAMTIKFGLAILFFPDLLNSSKQVTIFNLLEFLFPYFVFLIIETLIVVKWLNSK